MKINNMKDEDSIKAISSIIFYRELVKRGIKVSHINNYQETLAFLELSFNGHFEYIIGQNLSLTSVTANYAVNNKVLTKSFLFKANLNVAEGRLFGKESSKVEVYKYIKSVGYPLVIKKFNGTHGDLVFVSIRNKEGCDRAIESILKSNKYFLVEKMFIGQEYRIIATREKFIAAALRRPANVVGDGIHNIQDLISIKNSDQRRGDKFSIDTPLKKIEIDIFVKQCLLNQRLDLDYVPPKDITIYLRENSNISTGGESVDVTDQIHPGLQRIAVEAVRSIPGLSYAGVDLMTNQDITKEPTDNSYIIVELNSSPGISLHHFPYQGKSRNVAKEIVDLLFPETKK
jgi:D-alanine-D-alanine ligase-like ATP-grasp enzyme